MKFTICDLRFTRCLLLGKRVAWCVLLFTTLNLAAADSQDAELKSQIIGSYASGKSGEICIYANRSFHSKFSQVHANFTKTFNYEGTWQIKDGFWITTITNAWAVNSTNFEPIGSVDRVRIIKVDSKSMVLEEPIQFVSEATNQVINYDVKFNRTQ